MIKLFSFLFHVTYLLGMAAVTIAKSNKNPALTPEENDSIDSRTNLK